MKGERTVTDLQTKGADKMVVKKVTEMMRICDFDVSKRTRGYLERSYISCEDAIFNGRWLAYDRAMFIHAPWRAPKWAFEWTMCLGREGFIRPANDFALTFSVNHLLTSVYDGLDLPTGFDCLNNEAYENFRPITKDACKALSRTLAQILSEDEHEFLEYHYGISSNGISHTLSNAGKIFGLSERRANTLELKAIEKLRDRDLTSVLAS